MFAVERRLRESVGTVLIETRITMSIGDRTECREKDSTKLKVDPEAISRMVSRKLNWKLTSAVCIGIGIAIIVYPTDKSLFGIMNAILTPPPGYSGGWVGIVVKHWPSCILFLMGKLAWKQGE